MDTMTRSRQKPWDGTVFLGKRQWDSWEDAFWTSVVPGPGGCMISARSQCPAYGYSRVSFQGDRKYGHQVAIYLETGTWAGSEHVDHPDTCDKRCVNVAHLQVMTPSEHRAVTNARGENWPEGLDYKLGLTCRTGGCDKGVRVRGRELCSYHHARQIQPHHGKVG